MRPIFKQNPVNRIYNRFEKTMPLSARTIDQTAERIEAFLEDFGIERPQILRVRLSFEEALLSWQEHFGEAASVKIILEQTLRAPVIKIELQGEAFNPISSEDRDDSSWADRMLADAGLFPVYSYERNRNIIRLRIKVPEMNLILKLVLSVLTGMFLGIVGERVIPAGTRSAVISTILQPVRNVFFRMISSASGPVVFLTVLNAVCGVGSLAAMERSGRRMIARAIWISMSLTLVGFLLLYPAYGLGLHSINVSQHQLVNLLDTLFSAVPGDVLSPFIGNNSLQLIVIALVTGQALLNAGEGASSLTKLAVQANSIGLMIAGWVSRLAPTFIVILIVLGIWDSSVSVLAGLWQPFLFFHILAVGVLAARFLMVCRRMEMRPSLLLKKMKPSFLKALKTASVDEAYPDNQACCEKQMGISRRLFHISMPLGLVIYMPAGTLALMTITMYAAYSYGMHVTPVWFILLIVLCVFLQLAAPPVSGAGLLCYAAIFSALAIPEEALTIAMAADVMLSFTIAAVDQAMMQLELLIEAERLAMLKKDVLRRDESC